MSHCLLNRIVISLISSSETSAPATIAPQEKPSSDVESDREISPKLIVGSKKYGRRSRPTQNSDDEVIDETSDSDNEAAEVPNLEKKASKVQRSVSQSDVHGAKRRRPLYSTKLKRCASLPAHKTSRLEIKVRQQRVTQELNEDSLDEDNAAKISALTQNLRVVWNSFQSDTSDTLNFQQLEIVCERVGLHRAAAKLAAEEVFDKLSIKRDAGIRFEEFMNLIQSDSDMFSSVENIGKSTKMEAKKKTDDEDSQMYQEISPTWSSEAGSIEMENLIELWTSSNVPDAEELVKSLGFNGKEVKLSELGMVLEEEVQRRNTGDELATLLRASLALHRAEISSIRRTYRQLADENKKLFTDNKEANRRATILAQEIDERHTNLEDLTKVKLKSIELRHNEAIKELTAQLCAERDHLGVLNARLESKIKSMESDEQRLQQDMSGLRDENCALESEQMELHKQITELLETNIKLNQDIADMEAGGDDGRHDSHNEEMLDLIEKIETLQMENSNLRDKNDELVCDVENLNVEVSRWKGKTKLSRDLSDDLEASTSSAIKRRGDSPSKSKNVEESPRSGKVRKTSNDVEDSDASGDWVALNSELASSTPNPMKVLNQKKEEEHVDLLKRKVFELEGKVSEYKSKSETSGSTTEDSSSDDDFVRIRKENEKLKARVKELEDNLEQMSREYENCEDYWQSKLNEERVLFDEDQRQSDEKFSELLQKMTELEDQFAAQTEKNNGRLSPIDEKCQLESQYNELENEMEELKVHAQSILDDKGREIEKLQLEISQMQNQSGMKTPPPENVSAASSPINYLLNQNTITGPIRDYQNPNWVAKKMEQRDEPVVEDCEPTRVISPIQKPQSSRQQQSPAPVEPETNKEMIEVCEALSMISNKSFGSNSIASLHEFNEGAATPTSVSGARESIKKMKIFIDHMREEIQELTTQRESLIMELQQLQEAKPILANAYVSSLTFLFMKHF